MAAVRQGLGAASIPSSLILGPYPATLHFPRVTSLSFSWMVTFMK